MPRTPRLSTEQLQQLRPLERDLRTAAKRGDVQAAKRLVAGIQRLLRETGHETRLQKAKVWLFEAALESGDVSFAARGFTGIRGKTRPRTRIYLEATALLAVCHLRQGNLDEAKPFMAEAIKRVKNIRSPRRQRQFYRRLVNRFEEEWALAVLEAEDSDELDGAHVQDEAGQLVAARTEDEILTSLGESLTRPQVDLLLRAYEFSHGQLPPAERRLLPSPEDKRKRREVGKTIYRATKRAIWKALCDPESDTYQMWFHRGLMMAVDRKVIGLAIASALSGIGLGMYAIAIPLTAVVIKLGVDVYCESYTPEGLMIGLDE